MLAISLLCLELFFHSKFSCACAEGLGGEASASFELALLVWPWGSGEWTEAPGPRISGRQEEAWPDLVRRM